MTYLDVFKVKEQKAWWRSSLILLVIKSSVLRSDWTRAWEEKSWQVQPFLMALYAWPYNKQAG